ncbi:TetR/AcrR family transcriptional regulator [Nocardioides sp. AE5]|uniref:TetR/AcrR family transcriptional regulator n=1 Tax=Nocardioides sp. AE5 TaxID=2962573 RepID=UPI002882D07A|nr:TetR/AcrR family transcriptional regulator [Nocardioides sp. AE5]MDT0201219.1 TetR/AcrR family transcriptional regulator [Nocardioides sp. AE5]
MAQKQRIRPRQERAIQMRRDLLDATVQLLGTVGADRLTTSAIVAQAHVSSGTFYRYFNDKAEILEVLRDEAVVAIRADLMAGVARAIDMELHAAIHEVVQTLVVAFEQHRDVLAAMVNSVASGTQSNIMPELEHDLFQLARVIPARHLPELPPGQIDELVFMTMGVTNATCLRIALDRPEGASRERLIDIAAAMLAAGFTASA